MSSVTKPHSLLRASSVLTMAHALLNSFAGLLSGTSSHPEEVVVLQSMKAVRFDAMGSLRSYWDFYFGFGVLFTISLLLVSVLLWQLAALARAQPSAARRFIVPFGVAFVAFAVISGRYFFVAPLVLEVVIVMLLGVAYASSRR